MKKIFYSLFALILTFNLSLGNAQNVRTAHPVKAAERWTAAKANAWYKQWGWLRGCDFIPSTAINQLEMWQADTFDSKTIDRELGWAESLGMNIMRVYLHHMAWEVDPKGFKSRMDQYLTIAHKHHIATLFVFFDDCWNPTYKAGKQPDPKPGVHNSGWVRDPGDLGNDNSHYALFERYEKDILTRFGKDKRIVLWDLYNEPGNSNYGNKSMALLQKAFQWAREVNPSQPVSSGVWNKNLVDLNRFQLTHSDVITYHNYENEKSHKGTIDSLRKYGRPLLCTEYMARRNNSTFANIMPMLKAEHVAAINWGLVSGKTNTIYAWDTPIPDGSEPKLWFHDIFRKDGTPYKEDEVKLIRQLTGK
ncbi:MAG: cellulase family glycosylhydrolase [Bacteroidota bacterium]|nr:cellulase family glycosylhydrolase [Bacteroidota bacterium]